MENLKKRKRQEEVGDEQLTEKKPCWEISGCGTTQTDIECGTAKLVIKEPGCGKTQFTTKELVVDTATECGTAQLSAKTPSMKKMAVRAECGKQKPKRKTKCGTGQLKITDYCTAENKSRVPECGTAELSCPKENAELCRVYEVYKMCSTIIGELSCIPTDGKMSDYKIELHQGGLKRKMPTQPSMQSRKRRKKCYNGEFVRELVEEILVKVEEKCRKRIEKAKLPEKVIESNSKVESVWKISQRIKTKADVRIENEKIEAKNKTNLKSKAIKKIPNISKRGKRNTSNHQKTKITDFFMKPSQMGVEQGVEHKAGIPGFQNLTQEKCATIKTGVGGGGVTVPGAIKGMGGGGLRRKIRTGPVEAQSNCYVENEGGGGLKTGQQN